MIEEIEKYHKVLNDDDVVPSGCYRMSSPFYGLICYVNNIISLYYSSNYHGIAIFISRAYKQVNRLKLDQGEELEYYTLILEYLSIMTKYVMKQGVEDYASERIPNVLKIEK